MKKNDLLHEASAKWGFTLIEILVVVTIIGLLAGVGAVTYSQFIKQSRDARRKADFELIRSALEQYRADTDEYPKTSFAGGNFEYGKEFPIGCDGSASDPCYMNKVPQDPNCNKNICYSYTGGGSTGAPYVLGAYLESQPSLPTCANTCSTHSCNYCLGPYGEQ